jgi:hypothetical protein
MKSFVIALVLLAGFCVMFFFGVDWLVERAHTRIELQGEQDARNGIPAQANPYAGHQFGYGNAWLKGWKNVKSTEPKSP